MKNAFGAFAVRANNLFSSPLATVLAFAFFIIWAVTGPRSHYSALWQLTMNTVSSVVTFLMVFILNYAQNRDTSAINAKLDALILAVERADNRMIGLERLPHSEAQAMQEEVHSLKAIAEEVRELESNEGAT